MMPYLCKNCGNKTRFKEYGTESGSCSISRGAIRYLDEENRDTDWSSDDDIDYGETEFDDWEGNEEILCEECDYEVEAVSQEEWDDWVEGEDEDNQKPKCNKLDKLKNKLIGGN